MIAARRVSALAVVFASTALLSCQKESAPGRLDAPPQTNLHLSDTSSVVVRSPLVFSWSGTDPDDAVAGFERRLLAGIACDSLARLPDTGWVADATGSWSCDLMSVPDGPVAFQVRARDAAGQADPSPATACFLLRLLTLTCTCSVSGDTANVHAEERNHAGDTLAVEIRYSWQLTETAPSLFVIVPWTNFGSATSAILPILVPGSSYLFEVRAMDANYERVVSDTCSCEI